MSSICSLVKLTIPPLTTVLINVTAVPLTSGDSTDVVAGTLVGAEAIIVTVVKT